MKELESHYGGSSDFRHYFSATDPDSFSAVTIFVSNYRRMIVHNENHHLHRQASNTSHEISHTLLEHVPTAIVGSNGQRFWDSEMEQEANWLGAALLVPREGALELARGWGHCARNLGPLWSQRIAARYLARGSNRDLSAVRTYEALVRLVRGA